MSRLWIDHVIYAVDDLDKAAALLFDREGLASVPGGRHEGWGTANRIVPLGESYLELITVVDVEEAEQSEFGRAVRRALTEDHPLVGWVIATDDIDGVAKRLELEAERKSRETSDGSKLSWRLAGLERAMKTGALPFFVQWEVPAERHPGAAEVRHETDPRGIAWVEVCTDEPDELREWVGETDDLPLRITDGDPALAAAAIETGGG
ncbi:MAG TPA: VOC family protein, partial [Thermoleophilaceae bacterium]|nr:VOC family protein [Thermoleophilaceae bacterium]